MSTHALFVTAAYAITGVVLTVLIEQDPADQHGQHDA
ncbi:MAG: heme exporter protein CcmD, partial [Mesorhizobium sp.]